MSKTIFDKILAKEIPAKIVHESDHCLAFHDVSPQAKIHVLVIPRKKIRSFVEIEESDATNLGNFLKEISKVANILGLNAGGYRVIFNCGVHGGQTVDYLHAHIIGGEQLPCWDGQKTP